MRRVHSFPTVIVDKNALFRIGLTHTLAETRYRVIAQYSALSDLPANFIPSGPCLFLIGIDKDAKSLKEDLLCFKQKHDSVHVVLLGEELGQTGFLSVIELSGDCYMHKDKITRDLLLKSLELVMSGQVVLPREFLQRLNSQWSRGPNSVAPHDGSAMSWEVQDAASPLGRAQTERHLSGRETAILMRLMDGASNKHIARELEIAEATVKVHVKSVLRKIHVKNRTQAATWALTRCSPQGVLGNQPHVAPKTRVGLDHASTGASPNGKMPDASARGIVNSEILAPLLVA
jgi:two-component system, NarL family, nitrate/nitrite response regulator NarL